MLIEGRFLNTNDFKVNTASGNGATTVFALTHTPISSLQLQVFIDGLCQDLTDDYSLSGTNITFVSAPALGQKIKFTYIKK
jgi:hypothetical protein